MPGLRLALIQLAVTADKEENITRAVKFIKQAAAGGAHIVALPECFICPYGTTFFPKYCEPIPGTTTERLGQAAKDNNVYLFGGSIPESEGSKIYNTCTVYNPQGALIAKHRKMHLFDIDVVGKIRFKESEVLTAGDKLTIVETPFCKIGVGICYDIRFAEMAQIYAKKGCELLIYPGAFNMVTGPAHWTLLQKVRALDNQVYVATVAPARDEKASYISWGHSSVANPWGEIVAGLEEKEDVLIVDIDLDYMKQVREEIPIRNQKRDDIYEVVDKQSKY